jgi:hypothetical protein
VGESVLVGVFVSDTVGVLLSDIVGESVLVGVFVSDAVGVLLSDIVGESVRVGVFVSDAVGVALSGAEGELLGVMVVDTEGVTVGVFVGVLLSAASTSNTTWALAEFPQISVTTKTNCIEYPQEKTCGVITT